MAFWGIEVKPGKPYTHSSKNCSGRLRISQATLAIGTATLKSVVQCNVGDKRPVLLCALLPNKTESLQLDLEFAEAEDVIFSVIGPRGIYLTGYYVGHNRHSNMQDDSESFGEDIANSETHESNHSADEDEYEDSFINDDEPEPLTPSPVSSNRDDDDEDDDDDDDDDDEGDFMKKKNGNGRHKRLKKRYQSIVSDDEMSVPESDDEDGHLISSICKNNKAQALGEKNNKETLAEVEKKIKSNDAKCKSDAVNSKVLESKDKVDVLPIDVKTEGKGEQVNSSMPSLAEVTPRRKSKRNKKKQESSKEEKATDVLDAKDDQKPNDMGEVLTSAEADSEKKSKPKKKRKRHSEVNVDGTDNNLLAGNKLDDDQHAINKSPGVDSNDLANGNQSDEKKVKKKRRKASKTQEIDGKTNIDVEKENNRQSPTESESCNKKTLSNGLVIEDLVTGNFKGKVAAARRKVKVQYVVKLKENGQVISSNGNTPHKFRLGDKEVIEGLNVGLEGMRVGDRRRLTIPPSMSLGYKRDGENVPPNSWLVYDVEMTSIH
ncbi:hypothetical protein L1987_39332 [Smallanthus sonchifolius]|uniref:Uncharacterized protein n=1 Tax=Smallanthus sonchifolius TaxID=185202 RepID=A0ACB9HMV8_9ASTR|nr:hypothetical protein L1987_39332 [Smallanthus sonchifolius]